MSKYSRKRLSELFNKVEFLNSDDNRLYYIISELIDEIINLEGRITELETDNNDDKPF